MSEGYKRLLPAPTQPSGSGQAQPEASSSSAVPQSTGPPLKRRVVSKAACNSCRLKKTRCDGKRPTCTACLRGGLECNYVTASSDETPFRALKREVETLRKTSDDMLELYELLRTVPDATALDILRRLKSIRPMAEGADHIAEILAVVKQELENDPPIFAKVSNRQLIESLRPSIRDKAEFELMMRCPAVYPTLVPVEVSFINLADMLKPPALGHGETDSSTRQHVELGAGDTPTPTSSAGGFSGSTPDSQATPGPEPSNPMRTISKAKSHGPSVQLDRRLEALVISRWTNVPISNELAATLISFYLETTYRWCPLFDADLFLDGLLSGTSHFCSRLLVSSLLSWVCQCHSSLQSEVASLALAFEIEAEELWQLEKHTNTLTAVAAAQLLSNAAAFRGREEFSKHCLEEGVMMGQRMGLFGVKSQDASALAWLNHQQDWLRAACHTSWGIFMCVCMHSLHVDRGVIETPPLLPMPGQYIETHEHIQHAQHQLQALVSSKVGDVFQPMCHLALIVHDIVWTYFNRGDMVPVEQATINFAEQTYLRLFKWAASLPIELARENNSEHPTSTLRIYFHCAVIELFRPFLRLEKEHEPMQIHHVTSAITTPREIYASSVNQLKRLILLRRTDLEHPNASPPWHLAFIYLANAMLHDAARSNDMQDPECYFYFMLCIAGCQDMHRRFRVVELTILGLLAMALRNGFLTANETNIALKSLREIGSRYGSAAGAVQANFMVDLDLALTKPREAEVKVLASQFHELAMFDEFTIM
ncbi:hypothetical protein F4809DRAFT_569424 [Biscogniauxia mediterranea]|nr:hypothetical protein F4809DRAFT_569424 [Biscogniauxia mediterranea]